MANVGKFYLFNGLTGALNKKSASGKKADSTHSSYTVTRGLAAPQKLPVFEPDAVLAALEKQHKLKDAGFTVCAENNSITIAHNKYKECIRQWHVADNAQATNSKTCRQIERFINEVAEYKNTLRALLKDKQTFALDRTSSPPTLKHQPSGTVFTLEGKMTDLIDTLSRAKALIPPRTKPLPPVSNPIKHNLNGKTLNIKHQTKYATTPAQHILVVDNSVLNKLLVPVDPDADFKKVSLDQTWVKLLNETLSLPNVQIVIPAFVADYEACSFVQDVQNNHLEKIFHPFDKSTNPDILLARDFFKDATYVTLNEDGTLRTLQEGNPKLVVWFTKKDRELATQIRELAKQPKKKSILASISGRDYGDDTIKCLLNELSHNATGEVTVLTNDHGLQEDLQKQQRSTAYGYPVSCTNLYDFLQAWLAPGRVPYLHESTQNADFAIQLNDRLIETCEQYKSGRPTLYSVIDHQPLQGTRKNMGCYAPHLTPSSAPKTLDDIIAEGLEMKRLKREQYFVKPPIRNAIVSAFPNAYVQAETPPHVATVNPTEMAPWRSTCVVVTLGEKLPSSTDSVLAHGAFPQPYKHPRSMALLQTLRRAHVGQLNIDFANDEKPLDVAIEIKTQKETGSGALKAYIHCKDADTLKVIQPTLERFHSQHELAR